MAAGMPAPRVRRRYHFHLPGVIYVGVTVFLSIGALNSQNNLLFAALGLAIGGLLVSGIVSGMSLMGIRIERDPAADTAVGKALVLVYTVRNTNRFMPAFGLTLCELEGGDPAATWPRILRARPTCHIAHIGPGQMLHVEAAAWPHARGRMTLNAVQAWSTFPFGIAKKSVTFFQPQTVVVRPLALPLRIGVVDEKRRRAERGAAAGRFAGAGDEFWALREYMPGDLPRHIAWRATARTGQLLVTQRAAPVPTRAWVVLRLAPDAAAEANERAICLTASLIQRAADDGVSIGLAIPASGVLRPPDTHRWHVERLLNELADVLPSIAGPQTFPAMAARSGACIVVWAGQPESSWGPQSARHISADSAERLVAGEASIAAIRGLGGPARQVGLAAKLSGPVSSWARSLMRGRGEIGS